MSTDYDAVCDMCRELIHAGQSMGGKDSFGYGSNDENGRVACAAWLFHHCWHGDGVRIIVSDMSEPRPSDDYRYIELRDVMRELEEALQR